MLPQAQYRTAVATPSISLSPPANASTMPDIEQHRKLCIVNYELRVNEKEVGNWKSHRIFAFDKSRNKQQ